MELTPKQKKFCDEYLIDLNATQAAIRAGYSRKTAVAIGAENLRKPQIQTYIQDRRVAISQKTEITQERIIEEYAKIAFADIRVYFDEDGRLKNVHDLDDAAAAALAAIEVDEIWGASMDGRIQIGETKKIKQWDKIKALDAICRVLGYDAPSKLLLKHQGEVQIIQLPDNGRNTKDNQASTRLPGKGAKQLR